MEFEIVYFHERVLAEIESWPADVSADYVRLLDILIKHGPIRAQWEMGCLN